MIIMNKIDFVYEKIGNVLVNKVRKKYLENILEIANFEKIEQPKIEKINTLAIVMPRMRFSSGGASSIYRIGSYLENKGIEVSYVIFNSNDVENLYNESKKAFKNFKGKFLTIKESSQKKFDIVMATNWLSVYYARLLSGYKIYFVQDFEPYFHEIGDEYFLAMKTYTFGFHMISLGKWNKEKILENCKLNDQIDYIDFPYEPTEYTHIDRDYNSYKNKKDIKIAVYIKDSGRRIPEIIKYILNKTKIELSSKGYNLEAYFYGCSSDEKIPFGKNLSLLTKQELNMLYQSVDFGMVASMTNISLVPYEMIATGLPTIDFIDGSYKSFMDEDTAILISLDYRDLVNKLEYYINNPQSLQKMQVRAFHRIEKLSWNNSCEQFWQILCKIVKHEN